MSIDIPAVITEFHGLLTARNETPTEEQVRDGSVNLAVHAMFYYHPILSSAVHYVFRFFR